MLNELTKHAAKPALLRPTSKHTLAALLLWVQLLPHLPLTIGVATSMALGTTVASLGIIGFCWISVALNAPHMIGRSFDFLMRPLLTSGAILAIVLLHALIASFFEPLDVDRCMLSFLPLILLLSGGLLFGRLLALNRENDVDWAIRCSFAVLCMVVAIKLAKQYVFGSFEKTMFPFAEPSFFALAFGPVYMYKSVQAVPGRRVHWIVFGMVVALALQSVALVVGCIFTAAACRKLYVFVLAAVVIGLIGLPLNLEYFTSRLDFSGSVLNLSNLVFVQAWQMVAEALSHSQGWGVGFQQMGIRGTEVSAAALIHVITDGEDYNITDGGFVFSKLASEFGVWGILLSIAFIAGAAQCMMRLRNSSTLNSITFARCVVVAYGVDMFFRGPGYFVESTLIFVAAVGMLLSSKPTPVLGREVSRTPSASVISR